MTTKPQAKHSPTPTLLELLEAKLEYAEPRDRTVNIKIAINTAHMIAERERLAVNNFDAMREALEESVNAMRRMDRKLLELTNSPLECEKGEIARSESILARIREQENIGASGIAIDV